MLVNKNEKTSGKKDQVYTFRLNTGEEVVAKVVDETLSSYFVTKPSILMMQEQSPGNIGIGLQPAMFSIDINSSSSVELIKSSVSFVAKTNTQIRDAYIQATSGIKMAGMDALNALKGND